MDALQLRVFNLPQRFTTALTNATTSYILTLADKGWRQALHDDPHLRNGLTRPGSVLTSLTRQPDAARRA
jgi:alanine dehydrogenase